MMNRPIITLTTDFGTADGYVAQMKGVILGINPNVQIVDVTHAIPPQNIEQAADILDDVVDAFPQQTIHLVVVDPGVGTNRRIVAVESKQRRFVAADNGVLSNVLARDPLLRTVEIDAAAVPSRTRSNTFHGRDVMAPVAAYWSLARDPVEFGRLLDEPLQARSPRRPQVLDDRIVGEIIRRDRFGNLITNIRESDLFDAEPNRLRLEIGSQRIDGLASCYADRPFGTLLILIGSSGRLEIAVNGGNASQQLAANIGTANTETVGIGTVGIGTVGIGTEIQILLNERS